MGYQCYTPASLVTQGVSKLRLQSEISLYSLTSTFLSFHKKNNLDASLPSFVIFWKYLWIPSCQATYNFSLVSVSIFQKIQ